MNYALDTNTIIHYLRKEPNVLQNFDNAALQGSSFLIPKVVDYEIRRGFSIISAPKKEAAYQILTELSFAFDYRLGMLKINPISNPYVKFSMLPNQSIHEIKS